MAANQRSRQTNSASTKKNITGKTSAGRKTTSTRKKTAGSRQQASRRNASSAQKNRRTSRMQVQDYDEPIGDEIKLIVILAVCHSCFYISGSLHPGAFERIRHRRACR